MLTLLNLVKNYSKNAVQLNNNSIKMKFLNVAEKNDAAKTIAGLLSRGTARRRDGLSVYNKIYEFDTNVLGQNSFMVMTSVSGHLLTHAFVSTYKSWTGCDPIMLFDAPVVKTCPPDYEKIKSTLQREVKGCQGLIIWTDCDREGENIGFEIIDVCRGVKPNIPVYRAKFSEITTASIRRALDTLGQPDEKQSQAVDVRSELDLRIGAAFTRFQTMRFQKLFPDQVASKLVSYGSCQFPTLGFVAQRYKEAENFISQTFWKIKVLHTVNDLTVEFIWARKRLFDRPSCEAFFIVCQANPNAVVTSIVEKPKNKWRPVPLDTVELEKLGSRKLKITAKETMTIAEKLYSEGIISYPRTETNIFSKDINLKSLVEIQTPHPDWGQFANKVLGWGINPRNGTKSDQAHPPIHPTKFTTDLGGNEKRVYDLIVRHFLACVSRDAKGSETIVNIIISNEEFVATGLCIHERNYLEVYVYDKWNAKEVHNYKRGNTFTPTEISMPEGNTTAPQMLTEADLIALMEKHGIGTDATHAEHINTVKERGYIGEIEGKFLVPGTLGMGLVEGYDAINLPLAQPKLRAELETALKLICEGRRIPAEVLTEQIQIYKEAYKIITEKVKKLDETLSVRLNETPRDPPPPSNATGISGNIFKCIKCNQYSMILRTRKDNAGYFMSCAGFPDCKNAIWFDASIVKDVKMANETCSRCGPGFEKLIFTFKQRSVIATLGASGDSYKTCVVCDQNIKNLLNISEETVRRQRNANNSNTLDSRGLNTRPTMPAASSINRNNRINNFRSDGFDEDGSGERTNFDSHSSNTRPAMGSSSSNRNNRINNFRSEGFDEDGSGERIQANFQGNTNTYDNNRNRGWFADSNSDVPRSERAQTVQSSWNNPNNSLRTTRQSGGENNSRQSSWNNQNNMDEHEVKCTKCNASAKKLTVRRDNPNKGRMFYTCSIPNNTCNFFQWVEESTSNNQPTNWGSSNANNNTRNTMSRPAEEGNGGRVGNTRITAKRKCGLCRQEGHTKLKCPRRADLDLM